MLFTVDISAWNLTLWEDQDSNRLVEDLMLFESICNSKWFTKTQIILVFAKMDLLKAKLLEKNFKDYTSDFIGDQRSLADVPRYLERKFLSQNRSESKRVDTLFVNLVEGLDVAMSIIDLLRRRLA